MSGKTGSVYAGTSGLVLPVRNKSELPEEYLDKSRLCFYGSLFNSIEINSSFYKLPLTKTVARWADEVPAGFKFTFKLWRNITHNKNLAFNLQDVKRFMDVINCAAEKKGSLLVQMPAGTGGDNINQLKDLLNEINLYNTGKGWDIAVEFRNNNWYNSEVYKLLDVHKAGVVIHDMPKSATPVIENQAAFSYIRFHGPGGTYRGSYDDSFLHEYAQYIKEWQHNGKRVYTYFNNTIGQAVNNLITLNKYVQKVS